MLKMGAIAVSRFSIRTHASTHLEHVDFGNLSTPLLLKVLVLATHCPPVFFIFKKGTFFLKVLALAQHCPPGFFIFKNSTFLMKIQFFR